MFSWWRKFAKETNHMLSEVQLNLHFHRNFTKLPQSLNLNPSNQSLPQPKLINGLQVVLHLRAISDDVWPVVAVGDFKTLLVRERTCSAPNCCL
ncbi:hypothetical protein CEXT_43721 [Caerostris extrusa]|uniref:Uncharacterized protein n=1 Tax=Caerostris extrusa TaxID=172846 RepID=A0AAV4VJ56_CAEEX|nr:hypothetical protein CEXT_43721 [Caerostris extrusa]